MVEDQATVHAEERRQVVVDFGRREDREVEAANAHGVAREARGAREALAEGEEGFARGGHALLDGVTAARVHQTDGAEGERAMPRNATEAVARILGRTIQKSVAAIRKRPAG